MMARYDRSVASPGITIFALLWTVLLLAGDFLVGRSFAQEWRLSHFAVTAGLEILFLIPFHCVAILLGLMLISGLRQDLSRLPAGGVKLVQEGRQTRAQLGDIPASLASVAAVGLTAIFGSLVLGAAFGNRPSGFGLGMTYGSVVAAGVVAAICARYYRDTGKDLVIDDLARGLTLPEYCGRSQKISVPFAEVQRVAIVRIKHQTRNGGIDYAYRPVLLLIAGGSHDLVEFQQKWKAEAFAEWLSERMNLRQERPLPDIVEEDAYRTIIA